MSKKFGWIICMWVLLLPGLGMGQNPLMAGGYLRIDATPTPNDYSVELVLYRECDGDAFPPVYMSKFRRTDGMTIPPIKLELASVEEVTPLSPGQESRCTDEKSRLSGLQELIYRGQVILTPLMGGHHYELWVDGCCRPETGTLEGKNWHLKATIDPTLRPGNSNPRPLAGGVEWVCEMTESDWDPRLVDADGDELRVVLLPPAAHEKADLRYASGFSALHPLNINQKELEFDPKTGVLHGTALMKGQSGVVSLLVSEFRDGKQIGSFRMDRFLRVRSCQNAE